MSDEVAFCLPAPDVIALQEGRSILAIAPVFLQSDQTFLIYPGPVPNTLPLETYYQPNFLPTAQRAIAQYAEYEQSDHKKVNLWARCKRCEIISDPTELKTLSELTIWSLATLENIIKEKDCIFFLYLEVHHLTKDREIIDKQAGKCIGLHRITINAKPPETQPVLSDHLWQKRYQQIFNRQPSPYPELEKLQGAIAQLNTPDSIKFDQYLQTFFGWQEAKPVNLDDPDLDWKWIKDISKLANSPEGNKFEQIVRQSLITLGFSNFLKNPKASLDPNATGGAGGIDICTNDPYSLVGECKASGTGKVDAGVCQQLIRIGTRHLRKNNYDSAIKIIFASGEFTPDSKQTAIEHEMNVMSGETLEKLVTLHAQYPGCIDLLELRKYLVTEPFGEESNEKINKYIAEVRERLKVRSQIIQAVKKLKEFGNEKMSVAEIRTQYNSQYATDANNVLSLYAVKDILIELSSPLTGYLGRYDHDHDCFYFVRDFPPINDDPSTED